MKREILAKMVRVFSTAVVLLITSSALAQSTTLTNYLDNSPIDATARKVVVLIHGWNPSGYTDFYEQGDQLRAVRDNLQQALTGSSWKLVLYHWESDADSGSVWNVALTDAFDWGTATTAAAHAYTDGGTLGLQLSKFPNLREVQFVAHSAGKWVAQQAAQMLLIKNPFVIVQIILLDPYIPDSVNTVILKWTPSFRPQSAENKMDSRGLLSWLLLFACCSLCALKPLGKERTSRAWQCPSSLSLLMGF